METTLSFGVSLFLGSIKLRCHGRRLARFTDLRTVFKLVWNKELNGCEIVEKGVFLILKISQEKNEIQGSRSTLRI